MSRNESPILFPPRAPLMIWECPACGYVLTWRSMTCLPGYGLLQHHHIDHEGRYGNPGGAVVVMLTQIYGPPIAEVAAKVEP